MFPRRRRLLALAGLPVLIIVVLVVGLLAVPLLLRSTSARAGTVTLPVSTSGIWSAIAPLPLSGIGVEG